MKNNKKHLINFRDYANRTNCLNRRRSRKKNRRVLPSTFVPYLFNAMKKKRREIERKITLQVNGHTTARQSFYQVTSAYLTSSKAFRAFLSCSFIVSRSPLANLRWSFLTMNTTSSTWTRPVRPVSMAW